MKIICENNMCYIWLSYSHDKVCVNFHLYIILASLHSFYASFYPPKKEKNVLHLVTLTRKYGITCINLNQSHLSAELVSLKVSFALFIKGCPVGLLKHHQAPVK